MINVSKLHKELTLAGITFIGCNDRGVVWENGDVEIQSRPDIAAIIAAHDPTPDPLPEKEIFLRPIQAPALYAEDVFVSSRDIKDDPLEALAEALTETQKGKGKPKSLDMIARSTLKALEHAMKEIDKLRLDVEQLKKKVK
jgi:ABC-type phosphate/phosphonate transport system substrate-binding protein